MPPSSTAEVVVVGAGAAGLAAARALHDAGVDAVVLEARDRPGGRIFTIRPDNAPVPIELGAEFLHGRAEAAVAELQGAGARAVDVAGERWIASRARLRPAPELQPRIDGLLRAIPVRGDADRTLHDALRAARGDRSSGQVPRLARQYVEGFHAADAHLASARAVREAAEAMRDVREARIGRALDGYDRVVGALAAPLASRIRYGAIVTRIHWAPGTVQVETRHPDGSPGPTLSARAAVVTVPLGVLQATPGETGAIDVVPAVRRTQIALDRLGMGSVVRLVFRFRERFWASPSFARRHRTQTLDALGFLHTPDEDVTVWWTAYPLRVPLLVGWRGGPGARRLAALGAEGTFDRALRALARATGLAPGRLHAMVEGAWTHDWDRDPFARGAYSYVRAGGLDAPDALARPVRGTLFFAGESTDVDGATGTVHGAVASGRRAARQVQRRL